MTILERLTVKPLTFKQHLITSIACSAVVGLIVACGGGSVPVGIGGGGTGGGGTGTGPTFSAFFKSKIQFGQHGHIFQPVKSPVLVAAMFQAGTPTPSDIPESFESSCNINPGLLPVTPPGSIIPLSAVDATGFCNSSVGAAVPPGGNGLLKDANPVFHAGTVQKLVVTGRSTTGAQIRCFDLTATASAADGDFLVPYYRPSDNALLLFNGTTQLGFACVLNVPAGDTVAHLTARWTKI
jgi:hypothetical protein